MLEVTIVFSCGVLAWGLAQEYVSSTCVDTQQSSEDAPGKVLDAKRTVVMPPMRAPVLCAKTTHEHTRRDRHVVSSSARPMEE